MTKNSGNWQDYPYLVEWVDSVNQWAKKYEIYEFIRSDDQGYLGRIPHNDEKAVFDFLKKVCSNCQGTGGYFDPEVGDDVECLPCLDSPVYVDLVHSVSNEGNRVGDQQSAKASGSDGILYFTASPY